MENIKYTIYKIKNGETREDYLLHPHVDGDVIYEFDTEQEALDCIKEISKLKIYENITLNIRRRDLNEIFPNQEPLDNYKHGPLPELPIFVMPDQENIPPSYIEN